MPVNRHRIQRGQTPNASVIPTILALNEREFKSRAMIMEGTAPIVQVDIMDGIFVPNESWDHPEIVAEWGLNLDLEIHCMIEKPMPAIERWRRLPRLKRAIIHAEIPEKLGSILARIRQHKLEAGLALSPGTPVSVVADHAHHLDMVLVMGGKPGRSGQRLNRKTFETVRQLRKLFPALPIGFDIGVSRSTIPTLVRAGATRLYAGHAIFRAPSPLKAYRELNEMAGSVMSRES
jgi:ribulose-phosphate 3-epimerase